MGDLVPLGIQLSQGPADHRPVLRDFLGGLWLGGEVQEAHPRFRYEAGEMTAASHYADAHLGRAETRIAGCHDDIAATCESDTGAKGRSVHRRDGRDRAVVNSS